MGLSTNIQIEADHTRNHNTLDFTIHVIGNTMCKNARCERICMQFSCFTFHFEFSVFTFKNFLRKLLILLFLSIYLFWLSFVFYAVVPTRLCDLCVLLGNVSIPISNWFNANSRLYNSRKINRNGMTQIWFREM